MLQRLTTPDEASRFKLAAAMKMEEETLKILEAGAKKVKMSQVRELFEQHRVETEGQIRTLREVFDTFGWDVDDAPCPAIEGIRAEAKANAALSDDRVVDAVLLLGALETEHHEIGVYENLITLAKARGNADAVRLLEENLEIERRALEKVKALQEEVLLV